MNIGSPTGAGATTAAPARNTLNFDAVIFDMDGVITKTAAVHSHAWKRMFDEYLRLREKQHHEPFREFTHAGDYLPYVDGRPRYKGVDTFLKSRDINLPFGDPNDEPRKETVCGLGNRKNEFFNKSSRRTAWKCSIPPSS
jgi:beta-phosphoglucomutase-like phosphatase (HAD superfamily)